jgi:hypothetical protein
MLKLLKLPSSRLSEVPDIEPLGSWFANLLYLDRRKCILITNSRTLYSFCVLDVKKTDLTDLGEFFAQHLLDSLRSEGAPTSFLSKVESSLDEVVVARTNSRSVLGSMNDLVIQIKVRVGYEGGVSACDVDMLNRSLNRIPMSAIGNSYAIDKMLELAI